jgi:hypothetical protein
VYFPGRRRSQGDGREHRRRRRVRQPPRPVGDV